MQTKTTNIIIVGVGGQGTLLTSRVIAEVAVLMGYDVKISEVHGMAQRGGSVVTQVRYGEKVYSPIIKKGDADILLAFEKIEAARWLDYLKPEGMVIINDEQIDPLPVLSGKMQYPKNITDKINEKIKNNYLIDASAIAEKCGERRAANVVLVGVLSKAIGLPTQEVEKAIQAIVPAKALQVNLVAFRQGQELI